jgi:uncharacterized protein (TIGR02996 family)
VTALETQFLDDLKANPHDPVTRLVYADWLEEQGREAEAACERFIARHRIQPWQRRRGSLYHWHPEPDVLTWFKYGVPRWVFERLHGARSRCRFTKYTVRGESVCIRHTSLALAWYNFRAAFIAGWQAGEGR